MEKIIVFVSMFVIGMMLMLPHSSAVQYQSVRNAVNERLENHIDEVITIDKVSDDRDDVLSFRMIGLGLLLSFFLVRISLNSVFQLMFLRLFTICWFSIVSLLTGLLMNETIFLVFIRSIAGFVLGIIFPLFWLSTGFNLLVFDSILGPIASTCRLIYLLALGS